jgi:hypothetical protein
MSTERKVTSDNPTLHRKRAAIARHWLADLSLPSNATEAHIQRLFGICAALVLGGKTSPIVARRQLQELVAQLRPFIWFRYTGDPIFALAVHRMLAQRQIFHESLQHYYDGCKNLPVPQGSGFDVRHSLFFDLCDKQRPHPTLISAPMPLIASLVQDGRSALLDVCRMIMTATSCGIHQMDVSDLPSILPKLGCSYATDWDMAATCILVRTCAYLGVSDAPPCRAAKSWLLDQQRSDGRFGLLLPKDCQDKQDSGETDSDFLPTVDALWTLAEIHRPGFMLLGDWSSGR